MPDNPRPVPTNTVGPFAYRFSPTPAAVRVARYVLAAWLERLPGVDIDGLDDLLVVCSELCTNAAAHSSGADLAVELRARVDGDAVVIEVEDDGRGFPYGGRGDLQVSEAAAESGRGLFIVAALTTEMSVVHHAGRTTVQVRRAGMLRHVEAPADPAMSRDFRSRGVQSTSA